jgi:hypothetical protein
MIGAVPSKIGPGQELAYAEITANQANISAITDITGLILPDFVVGDRPVEVELFLPFQQHTTAGTAMTGYITTSANAILAFGATAGASGGTCGLIIARARIITPGLYSGIKGRIQSLGNVVSGTIVAGATSVGLLRAKTL